MANNSFASMKFINFLYKCRKEYFYNQKFLSFSNIYYLSVISGKVKWIMLRFISNFLVSIPVLVPEAGITSVSSDTLGSKNFCLPWLYSSLLMTVTVINHCLRYWGIPFLYKDYTFFYFIDYCYREIPCIQKKMKYI